MRRDRGSGMMWTRSTPVLYVMCGWISRPVAAVAPAAGLDSDGWGRGLRGDGPGVLAGQNLALRLHPTDVRGREPRRLSDIGERDPAVLNGLGHPVRGLTEERCRLLRGEAL